MSKLSEEISNLMGSAAYRNSAHKDHAETVNTVEAYFKSAYPNDGSHAATFWFTENDERVCDECAELHGTEVDPNEFQPPLHPNCRCWIEEININNSGDRVLYSREEDAIDDVFQEEGGYEDNPSKIDQPTNMGITKSSLEKYNKDHPNYNFPTDVKNLIPEQARQIYREDYYRERRIGEINHDRISRAILDMGVMSNFKNVGKIVQNMLNDHQHTRLKVDGVIGSKTIEALNNISEDDLENFMEELIENRLDYLRDLPDWSKYGRGWASRTKRY